MSLVLILRACLLLYLVAIVVQSVVQRSIRRFLFELGVLTVIVVLALLVTNASTGKVSFGDGSTPLAAVAGMFVATLLGIFSRYVFFLQEGQFSWLGMLKPLTISPIVVLPLIGSVQGISAVSNMQLVSFAFLAFQNGFFWQAVLHAARPAVQPKPAKG